MSDKTKIADIIDPEIVAELVATQYADASVLLTSGAVRTDTNGQIKEGGQRILIPRWNRASAAWQELSESTSLTTKKVTAASEYGVVVRRGDAFSVLDTAKIVSAQDPNAELARQISMDVGYNVDSTFISLLKGAIPTATNQYDYSGTGTIVEDAVMTAKGKAGDKMGELKVFACHSKVYTDLLKRNVVQFKDAQNDLGLTILTGQIPTYLGMIVLVSDKLTVVSGTPTKYHSLLLGMEALYNGVQSDFNLEMDRDILAKEDLISYDIHFVPHLVGMSWKSTSPLNPTDANIETAGNWELKASSAKLVRAIRLITQ